MPHRARLVIGPLDTAGQATQWARSLRRHGAADATCWSMEREVRSQDSSAVDRAYPLVDGAMLQAWHDLFEERPHVTHLLLESARPISIRGTVRRMTLQAATARLRGISPALIFHGSDIRVPSVHASEHPDSPFHGGLDGLTERLELRTQHVHRWLRVWPFPIFVTTIGLKRFVPRARWLPVVADASWFAPTTPISVDRSRPRVLHLPSRRALSQSDRVDQVGRRLHDEGLIEYRSITGVAASEMRRHVEWSDIVLDKFGLGGTGVMGAEAMASGRLLVGEVDQIVHDELPDLPLIRGTFATLEPVLRDLVADRSGWAARAAAGEAFARRYHDGRHSAAVLAEWMGVELNRP